MKYCLTFLMLSAACVAVSMVGWDVVGWPAALPLYAALSFALLSVAYAGVGPRLLLKRATGRRAALGWLLFAPYFLLNALILGLCRLLSREPAYVEVTPGVFFGRRLSAREHSAVGWASVLDLAGEFPAAGRVREASRYWSLPVLDATAPSEEELRAAVAWIREATAAGPVYVHCALGHGRSACVVVAYLLTTGTVQSVEEGVQLLRSLRPAVRLHPPQLRLLRRLESPPKGES